MSENVKDQPFKTLGCLKYDDLVQVISPDLYEKLNLNHKIILIDPYNPIIDPKISTESRICDLYIQAKLKNGENAYIFVENQSYDDPEMPLRIYQTYIRILNQEKTFNIYPICIFSFKDINKIYHNEFKSTFIDTGINLIYKTYDIYKADENELINDDRPFSIAILTMKYLIDSDGDPFKRGELGVKAIRILRSKHLSLVDEFIYSIFIINYLHMMDDDISMEHQKEFNMELMQPDQIFDEIIVSMAKEQGIKEGREEGREEGRKEVLSSAAKKLHGFGMPVSQIADMLTIDKDKVQEYLQAS